MHDGSFHRILFEADRQRCLERVPSGQGRFHHDGQPALYMSPHPDWAWLAVAPYVRDGDPPRIAVPLALTGAALADLRDPAACRALGVDPADAAADWRGQLGRGERPVSWRASDAVRDAGADGMIYPSRTAPERWHIVLFRWNHAGGPRLVRRASPIGLDCLE